MRVFFLYRETKSPLPALHVALSLRHMKTSTLCPSNQADAISAITKHPKPMYGMLSVALPIFDTLLMLVGGVFFHLGQNDGPRRHSDAANNAFFLLIFIIPLVGLVLGLIGVAKRDRFQLLSFLGVAMNIGFYVVFRA